MNLTDKDKKTPKERVEQERAELEIKIRKLSAFLAHRQSPITTPMVNLLREQLNIMREYDVILTKRLMIWDEEQEDSLL